MAKTLTATFKLIDEMSAKLDSIARSGERAIEQWDSAGQTASGAFDTATASASSTTEAMDRFEREALEASQAIDNLANAGEETERALEENARVADNAGDKIEDYGNENEKAGKKAQEFGTTSVDAIQELSKTLTVLGIAKAIDAIYDSFANAVSKAIEFESAITGVYKTVDGTSEQLRQISADVREMSTVLPASTTEIAGVAEAAGQLGIATDDVTAFTRVMIDLGEATNLSSDEAASSLAKFTNITGMSATNYENLGSAVVALGNNFATTEADIVAMSTRMASAGTLAGLTEPEILALAASMSSVGIEADAGGSAMSKLLTDIQVAVETGSDRLDEFASVAGMTGEQFADIFGNKASEALFAFISGLNDVERNGATATVVLEDMGLTEVRLSNAIKSLANNSDGLSASIGVANTAWDKNTALANEADLRYGTLESRINMTKNASANLAAAIGEDLTPVIGTFVDAGRGILKWFTEVIEKNPVISAGLTAIAVAVSVVSAAITVFALVTSPIIINAINAITTAMLANPIFLIITGVVALTAAVVAFVAVLASQQSEYDTWTASTKSQYDELQRLNSEYENAVEVYGETSDEALALRYEVDELTNSFEANKMSVEDFVAECDRLVESHNNLVSSYAESTASLDYEAQGTLALISKLEQLGSKTSTTAAEQEQMKAIIDSLNQTLPDLALNYDDVTAALDMTIASLKTVAKEQAEQEKQAENYRTYVDLLKEQTALEEQLAAAEANLTAERERRNMVYDETTGQWSNKIYTEDSPWASWTTDLDEYNDALDELQTAYDENIALQEELTNAMGDYLSETEAAKDAQVSYSEAVSNALNSVKAEMNALIEKYDEVYEEARTNIDGVIGLFDTMKTETELSIADMTKALESQTEYLTTYTDNLRKAAEYGLDDGLIASLSDGSAESAGQLDAIIGKVEALGATTEEAAGFVSNFNAKFSEVQTAKDEFAATVADMQTGFSTAMDEIEKKLADSIDNMNMETEAAEAAKDTLQAYIQSIRDQQEEAVSAANAVANATAAALRRTPTIPIPGYAVGTASAAPGLALVGEEGPELISFSGGEIVYTAPETERIISNATGKPLDVDVPESLEAEAGTIDKSYSEKRITLDIKGSGEFQIGGGYDEDIIWELMSSNLKPVLMSMLKREIFEEGDRAYAF